MGKLINLQEYINKKNYEKNIIKDVLKDLEDINLAFKEIFTPIHELYEETLERQYKDYYKNKVYQNGWVINN